MCMQQDLRAALVLAMRAVVQRAPQVLPGIALGPVAEALAATAYVKVCMAATTCDSATDAAPNRATYVS